jgi:UDP-3-O-[3-hydroxymyristoyl] glucosamine N-acyltransferase
MGMKLEELSARIGTVLRGDRDLEVSACAGLDTAGPKDISFVSNRKYVKFLDRTRAGAVVVSQEDADREVRVNLLIADDPYFAFREAVVALHGFRRHPKPTLSEQASIDPSVAIGGGSCIQPFVFIAEGARIGKRSVIYPHCYVGREAVVGDDCILYPSVTIYDQCILGDRVTLHTGCVIGQDGFGYATHQGGHHKIPQVGTVVIEDDVELGANCTIDRATVGSTRIGKGTKCSNLVAIGHGTQVGSHNLLVAQVGVAGSVQTGSYVSMGGQAGVAGHLKIGRGAQVAAKSGVMNDVPPDTQVGGQPAQLLIKAKRNFLALSRFSNLLQQVRELHKKIKLLETRQRQEK